MTNSHFTNKEHYIAFRAAWSKAVNSEKARSHTESCDEWILNPAKYTYTQSKGTGTRRVAGWVQARHHILYNILRNRVPHKGFTVVRNKNKLSNGTDINSHYRSAIRHLQYCVEDASLILTNGEKISERFRDEYLRRAKIRMEEFLAPFDGTVTIEMLSNIKLPTVRPISSIYGAGRTVAYMIMSGKEIITTIDQLDNLYSNINQQQHVDL